MNHTQITAMRSTITHSDLLICESWAREQGRKTVHEWTQLSDAARADLLAIGFALARERQIKRGFFLVPRMQQLRLERGWSYVTASKKLCSGGLPKTTPQQVLSLEINIRKRAELDMKTVHAYEDLYDESWETLIAPVVLEKIPVPARSYEKDE